MKCNTLKVIEFRNFKEKEIDLNGKKVTEKRKKIRHCDELVIDGDKFKFIGVSQ